MAMSGQVGPCIAAAAAACSLSQAQGLAHRWRKDENSRPRRSGSCWPQVKEPFICETLRRLPGQPMCGFGGVKDPLELLAWFKARGGWIHEDVEIAEIPGAGWGLRVKSGQQLKARTLLIRVPPAALLAALDSDRPEQASELVPGEELPTASALLRQRLAYAWLDQRGLASQSLAPLIHSLRPPPGLPLLLLGDEVAEADERGAEILRGTVVRSHSLALRAGLLEEALRDPRAAAEPEEIWKAWLWAQAVIMSRVFKLPKGGERVVLVPVVDIANHAVSRREANAAVQDDKGGVSLHAVKDLSSGAEIRICYGEYSNEQLLFCYGFVIPDNPHGGPMCPLMPDSAAKAALLQDILGKHRGQPDASPLRLGSGKAKELLLAMRVLAMSDSEVEEARNQLAVSSSMVEVRMWDVMAALRWLKDWEQELAGAERSSKGLHGPAHELRLEVQQAVREATDEVARQLPAPLYWHWRFRQACYALLQGVAP